MRFTEQAGEFLRGRYRDIVRAPDGTVLVDRGWHDNAIVADCRRLLASFMAGKPGTGIGGVLVGSGQAAWDVGGPPAATPAQAALVDPHPFLVPAANLQIDFLDNGGVTALPTNRIQIVATIGPGKPPWPDAHHAAASLREFGLVGHIGGTQTLINYVTHPVINKDPTSTLERTIWLVF
jgi:hypothetical protein